MHQTRKNRRGGGLCIFLLESLSYKVRDDITVNSSAIECLCVEIFNKNSKSIVLNLAYRPPNDDPNEIENHFKNILSKREITNKKLVLAGDLNINVLDFNETKMVQNFVNLMFRHGLIPTINEPTRGQGTQLLLLIISSQTQQKMLNSKQVLCRLAYPITFPYSSYLNVLLIVLRPGKNLYTNEITPVIQ